MVKNQILMTNIDIIWCKIRDTCLKVENPSLLIPLYNSNVHLNSSLKLILKEKTCHLITGDFSYVVSATQCPAQDLYKAILNY